MNTARTRILIWVPLLALVIAACGDANGDTTPTPEPPANDSVIAEFQTTDGESYRALLTGGGGRGACPRRPRRR